MAYNSRLPFAVCRFTINHSQLAWQYFCIYSDKLPKMKNLSSLLLMSLLFLLTFSSCEVIGGIFKAGVWVGILAVVFVIAIIIWLVSRFRNKG